MLEQGRPCVEIAQQMRAVERPIVNAKSTLVHDHIDNCLETALVGTDAKQARASQVRGATSAWRFWRMAGLLMISGFASLFRDCMHPRRGMLGNTAPVSEIGYG